MEVQLTPVLRSALRSALAQADGGASGTRGSLERYLRADATTILLADVQQLSLMLRAMATDASRSAGAEEDAAPVWVHELLQGAAPVLPDTRKRAEPHPDLAPRLKRLREAQESRDYAAMVGDITGGDDANARDAAEMATYRSQVSAASQASSAERALSFLSSRLLIVPRFPRRATHRWGWAST